MGGEEAFQDICTRGHPNCEGKSTLKETLKNRWYYQKEKGSKGKEKEDDGIECILFGGKRDSHGRKASRGFLR